jgi:ribosome biogenesis GTPase A
MSAKTQLNLKKIIELVIRENNPKFKTVGTWCMIGGIPNVGKSTIINTFRGMSSDIKELSEHTKKSAKTGTHATTTRHIDSFKVNLEPVIYIMDTPGIMPPKIYNPESGLKLSICGNIKDKIAGKEIICDYLLYSLNKNNQNIEAYKKAFRLNEPVYDANELITKVMQEFKIPNSNNAYDFVIRYFKDGRLGKITFDENISKELIYPTAK